MKRILTAMALALLAFAPTQAGAQTIVAPCVTGTGAPATSSSCSRVTYSNPLPTGQAPFTITAVAGHQDITLNGSAQTLTVPAGAKIADLIPEGTGGTNNECLYYRDDGTNPTSSTGQPLGPQQPYIGYSGPLSAFAVIAASGATCILHVSYYK